MKTLSILTMTCLLLALSPVSAQEKNQTAAVGNAALAAQARLDARTVELMEKLDSNQTLQLQSIRNGHGTIRAVENVQASIRNAVTACGERNPELKEPMGLRFDDWRRTLRPNLKKAQSKLEKMILLQSFAKPSEVRSYLKLFDEAITTRNAGIRTVPITEKAECENLIRSMDRTEKDLNRLIVEQLNLDQDLRQKEL